MSLYLLVAVGGALGSSARFWVGTVVAARLGAGFPYGTLAVNLAGSFLIGLLLTLGTERLALAPAYRKRPARPCRGTRSPPPTRRPMRARVTPRVSGSSPG